MTCAPKKVGSGGPKAFDMDAYKPPSCFFWNLGEKNCDGVKVQIKQTMFRKWEQLLTHLAQKCGCGQGVRALYTPKGHNIKDFAELTEGIDVVVVPSGYKFEKNRLPVKLAAKIGVPTSA
ncbi:ubiquitin-like protein [Tritrichomonas foetus]|uniref:Ubiquitin-like protein n=1 Tax=Tritrichomonas foetus TaxID=1144522 RepID=A0A1J4KU59_9EUKA|nr:ubiquitin-like protein [Tritrichomonas foetus]|eukprot:OHT13029.1 ubiquitin-like protein [Tritrichomonas foetus]